MIQRNLKKAAFKRQHHIAHGGGALRKNSHHFAITQCLRGLRHFRARAAAALARHKHRARLARQIARHRPMRHLGLSHKARRHHRIDGKYIQPRNMVGRQHQRARFWHGRHAVYQQAHAANFQQLRRPSADARQLPLPAQPRKPQSHLQHAAKHMQTDQTQTKNSTHKKGRLKP